MKKFLLIGLLLTANILICADNGKKDAGVQKDVSEEDEKARAEAVERGEAGEAERKEGAENPDRSCWERARNAAVNCADPVEVVNALLYRVFAMCISAGINYWFLDGDAKKAFQLTGMLAVGATIGFYTWARMRKCASKRVKACRKREDQQ